MYPPFSDAARAVMNRSRDEATRSKHEFVGTEHILLAMLHPDCPSWDTLVLIGVDPRAIRAALEKQLATTAGTAEPMPRQPQTPRARKAVEHAIEASQELVRGAYVCTDHLLLGLLCTEDSVATAALAEFSVTLDVARTAVILRMAATSRKAKDGVYVIDVKPDAGLEATLAAVSSIWRRMQKTTSIIVIGDEEERPKA